jgi:outer membrane protein OmpA-like peptidoglycan-associated protein
MVKICLTTFLLVAVPFFLVASPSFKDEPVLAKGYYIVVAAFLPNQVEQAKQYSEKINRGGKQSKYGFDAERKLYYVYLDYFADFSHSIDQMLASRKEGGFADSWVRIIKGDTQQEKVIAKEEPQKKVEEKKATNNVAEKPAKAEAAVVKPTEASRPVPPVAAEAKVNPTPAPAPLLASADVIPNPKAEPVYLPQTLKNTQAFFSLYNKKTGQVIDGDVEVHDTDRKRLITKLKANSYLSLPDPKSKSGKLTLIGSAFGYQKIHHEMNYYNTEADTLHEDIDLVGNYYMVKFDMSRMVKGDIAILYNVYFYNDAAVMLPSSKPELNRLLQMLQENPNYKVMLHGHTNGNGRGKIIYVGPSKDFFSITKDDVVNESGSAKELSGARAQVIKEWLVAQKIDVNRIEVKAWGGDKMLHEKDSQHARRNVRVEVEVLQN